MASDKMLIERADISSSFFLCACNEQRIFSRSVDRPIHSHLLDVGAFCKYVAASLKNNEAAFMRGCLRGIETSHYLVKSDEIRLSFFPLLG